MDASSSPSVVSRMSSALRVAPAVVFVIITLLVIAVILAFIVYRVRRSDLEAGRIVSKPTSTKTETVMDKTLLPKAAVNGQEYSYTFWLYVVRQDALAKPAAIFRRGDSSSLADTTMLAMMHPTENRMYICAGLNSSSTTSVVRSPAAGSSPASSAANNAADIYLNPNSGRFMVATVDYVPLQRWVNYTVVVADNMLTVYQDGSVYTVQHIERLGLPPGTPRPTLKTDAGNVTVGSSGSGDAMYGAANAFVANMYYFNYALSQQDANAIYARGPVPWSSRVLSMLGIPEYGIRSPVYRLDSVDYNEEDSF